MYSNGASNINSSYQLNEMENYRVDNLSEINYIRNEFKDDNDDSIREHQTSSFDDSIDDEDDYFVFEPKAVREE